MKFGADIKIRPATSDDRPIIQNLARFYVYDISRYCGLAEDSFNWAFPEDGLYDCPYFNKYWNDPNCSQFLLYINDELGGFVIVNKTGISPDVDWNLSEFFIVAKFQGKGIGQQVAMMILDKFRGTWEISQLPSNKPAVAFWKKVILEYTKGDYLESKESKFIPEPHDMITLRFEANT